MSRRPGAVSIVSGLQKGVDPTLGVEHSEARVAVAVGEAAGAEDRPADAAAAGVGFPAVRAAESRASDHRHLCARELCALGQELL